MTTNLDDPRIAKLPAWVQAVIATLETQRDVAVRVLNDFCEQSKPSPFYVEDYVCTGESVGPKTKRVYVQTNEIVCAHAGVHLTVRVIDKDSQGRNCIRLQWSAGDSMGCCDVAMIPESYQNVRLVAREEMRS